MTNKKLKMAAMSVALTACVAASPLAANADAPEAAPVELEKEPVAEETKKEENTAEPQDNKQAKNAQETLKDAEVKYDKDNPTTNPDGSQKLDGVIVTNPEGSGETDPDPNPNPNPDSSEANPNPNPDSGETNPNPDSGETNPNPNPDSGETNPNPNPNPNPGSGETAPEEIKPEEKESEEKKPEQIGTAKKTEKSETNVETKPNPGAEPIVDTTTPPTVEKNPDGSTTITQTTVTPGTETTTTTTTGTGTAKGDLDTVVTETPKEKIDLEKELGKVNPDISWNIEKGADAVNGYKVEDVTNSDDGNKQTLKLRKEEETTAEMTAEDIAKLVDAEKPTVNPDGTYTLTRTETVLDAEGNPQTRTTYITIQDNKVTTKTTTELTITRQKEKQEGNERVDFEVKYPEITVTNKGNSEDTQTISRELLDTILSQNPKEDGSYEYTDGEGQKYEIRVDETAKNLNNAEIVARLKQDGHTEYTLGADGEIYYTTPHNETVKLDVTQNQLLRRSLTYKVTLTTTEKGEKETAGEQIATEKAKMNATRDALTKAVDALGVDTATASQLKAKISDLKFTQEQLDKGDTFEVTLKDGKKYTLTYSDAEAKVTASTPTTDKSDTGKKPEDITDVKDNTVTGTAYVTGSKITYLHGEKYETTGMGGLGIGENFNTKPDGATDVKTDPNTGRITSYKDKDGNTHSFTYESVDLSKLTEAEKAALEKAAKQEGWTTENLTASLTRVRWTVMSPETTEPKTEKIENGETVDFVKDNNNWSQTDHGDTVDFTHGNKTYAGMTLDNTSEDGKTKTYKKTEANGTVTIITVTTQQLDIKAKFDEKFGEGNYEMNAAEHTVTYTGEDGKTYKASYVDLEEKLTVEVQKPQAVAATGSTEDEAKTAFLKNLEEARQKAEDAGETLVIEYKDKETGEVKHLTVHKDMKWDEVSEVVGHVVNYNAMTNAELVEYLNKLETTAKNAGKYYDGSTDWNGTPYYWDATDKMMKRVPPENVNNIKWDWWHGRYYVEINSVKREVHYNRNDIDHLDLATDSKLTLSEKEDGKPKTDDCVLVNPKLEWNYSAENLLADQNALARENRNKNVGLDNKISYDKSGHYEYDRGDPNNHPNASAFYKVTGTVAYDAVKENGKVKLFTDQEEAVKAYLTAVGYGKTYEQLNEKEKQEILSTYVVQLGPTRTNSSSPKGYQVYKKSSTMTAYGYMSDDNNTCGNALFEPGRKSKFSYIGGYDLTLGNLTQTDEKHVVAMGKNTTALSATFMRTKKLPPLTNKELNYTPISKKWVEVTPSEELSKGEGLSGSYQANYTKTADYTSEQQKGIEGTGTGSYKSFTNLIQNIFKGDGTGTVEGGFIKYEYHTEKTKDGDPVQFEADRMVVTTKQDAEVHYTFTSQESRDVWIKGYTQTVVPPVNPGPDSPELPPVEDAKPAPAPAPTPEAPVLPVVQDARPDPAPAPAPAPETPVLPAVQDAKLIQTGTSGWLADLMLGAGMVLSAAGYWMERKRKAMFYKSQH